MVSKPHERTTMMLKNLGAGGAVSVIKILIQLALLPMMAHFLGPKEFGLYALTVPVVAFLVLIADGGVGLSLAKDQTNSPTIWSTAFWVLMASGIIMSIGVIATGYLLSVASSEPQLKRLMLILAMGFPFLNLAVLPTARLIRSGNLVACATVDLLSTVFGAVCALGLGYMGFGATSLAVQSLAACVVRAAVVNLYAFERPMAVFRPSAMLPHLSTGGILMGGRVSDFVCRSVESLLFGNAFGPASLGAYNFASQVPRFLFESFSNPSWSALYAQSLTEEHDRLIQIFYKVCRLMGFVTFPTAAVLTAAGPEILEQALGPKWQQAGVFLRILAPGFALSATASIGTALLLALNANLMFFLATIVLSIGRVAAAAIGYYISAEQVIYLVTAINFLYALIVILSLKRIAAVKTITLMNELRGSCVAAVLSGLACWGVIAATGGGLTGDCGALLAAVICYFTVMITIEGNEIKNELTFIKGLLTGIVKKADGKSSARSFP